MRVLVTGASGFIGRRVCRVLSDRGHRVRVAVRSPLRPDEAEGFEQCVVGDIAATDWDEAVKGVDAIVHLAGRAHILKKDPAQAVDAFRAVNVDAAVGLFKAAQDAGVRRFVNVSSIGVLGQSTAGEPLSDASKPCPVNAYSRSKMEAEAALAAVAGRTELVTVRPPMVYGPGSPGNMLRLLRLVRTGLPLPLGLARGERDMIGIDNLADILVLCVDRPEVAGQTYVVCDGEAVSTSDLVRILGRAMGRRTVLFPVPYGLLAGVAGLLGRGDDVGRLFKPLRIDDRRFRQHTGWSPAVSLEQGLERTVRWFRKA